MRYFKFLGAAIIASVVLGSFASQATAASISYSASTSGNGTIQINVTGNAFSQVDFYARQGGVLWTTITNVGRTDQFGDFFGNVNPGLNLNSSIDSYVIVGGMQSPTITLNGNNNGNNICPLNPYVTSNCNPCVYGNYNNNYYCPSPVPPPVGGLSASQTNVTVNAGSSATVYLYTPPGLPVYVSNGPVGSVATASLSGNTLIIYGNYQGNTSVQVCTNNSQCVTIYITVNGFSQMGNITFSNNNVTLGVGQAASVYAYNNLNNFSNNQSFYISSNSNSYVASASVSGNIINIYGNAAGSTAITVCGFSSSCGVVNVTVGGATSLSFLTTTMPQATASQYYSQTIQVTGGRSPFYFSLQSGALTPGLTLSTLGTISGTPSFGGTYNFTVRVTDAYGNAASENYTLIVNGGLIGGGGGYIGGASTYANGTIMVVGNTIYIIYNNSKIGFANWNAFVGLGFSLNNAVYPGFTNIPDAGYVVNSVFDGHPWGSWVRSGNTIYFVHQSGLIPVPSYDIFLNNNGRDNLVVPIVNADWSKAMLSPMVWNDYRLNH